MQDLTKMRKPELVAYALRLQEFESEVSRVHHLLDMIEVPRRVSRGSADEDHAYDRIVWLIHRGVQQTALEVLYQQRDYGMQAIDKLKKMAAVYEANNGPDPGTQTHPWIIVRWVKENLD